MMMEEEVPSASTRGGTTRRQQVNQNQSSAATGGGYTTTSPQLQQQIDDDDDRIRRRNANRGIIHTITTTLLPLLSLSPTNVLSKLILLVTVLLKLLLSPLVRVSNLLFPIREFDNIASSEAATKAARAFVNMMNEDYIQPLRESIGVESAGNTHNEGDDDRDDDLDGRHLTCPFVARGYSELVNDIAVKAERYQSVRNSGNNVGNSSLNDNDELVAPPLMLIYLHSPLHRKVPSFLSNTLLHPSILQLLHTHIRNGTLVCWGGSVHTADGANAQNVLQVSSYPFLALVRVQPNTGGGSGNARNQPRIKQNLELHFRMEGPTLQSTSTDQIHTFLSHSLTLYQNILSDQAMKRLARLEEIRLREEQDREYREALEEDQRREREREEEARKIAEEVQKKQHEEEEKVRLKHEKLVKAREILSQEAPPTTASSGNRKVARIRLMLPSGKRLERTFWGTDTIDVVRAFLTLHFEEGNENDGEHVIQNFQLSSNYPKKALVDGEATLEGEGLCPQAVIMVQDLDA